MNNTDSLSIEITTQIPSASARSAVALCVFTDEPRMPFAHNENDGLAQACRRVIEDGEFKGEAETSLMLHAANGSGARRLLLVGAGAHGDFDAPALLRAAGLAARAAQEQGVKSLSFIPPEADDEAQMARAVAEGALFGLYDGGLHQNKEGEESALERLTIITKQERDESKREIERGRIVAAAVNWARTLSDLPGRDLPPRELARRAAEMATAVGLRVETITGDEVKERGFGALWGVGQGSAEKPALIVLRYEPEGAQETDELWAFVGKGITFDTGGISIKHGLDMYEMKADMAGGAAVLGAMRALAQLKCRRRIAGIIPAAENMPSGRALKPGDIVRTFAGHTIEAVDTDAEGRLVLVDGIAYARKLGATRIVDLATLTGSIIIALGNHRTGLFSNDDEWAGEVVRASERAGEPVWRMPVSDDYKKRIESDIADFKNYGGRPDATGAALLLSKFAGDAAWVHLDIAGTSWYDDPQPFAPKGSTGVGVRTLVELACTND